MKKYDVYVINLDERTDRWDHIQKEFGKYKFLNLIRFPVTKHEMPWKGCVLSHFKIVELAKEKNLDYVIVMEDDNTIFDKKTFGKNFLQIMKYLQSHLTEWEVFKFSYNIALGLNDYKTRRFFDEDKYYDIINDIKINNLISKLPYAMCDNFSIYNKNIYNYIITDLKEQISNPSNTSQYDYSIDILVNSIDKKWCASPMLTYQKADKSDILNCDTDYEFYFHNSNALMAEYKSRKKYDVYVINLDERKDRWEHIQKEFKSFKFINLIRWSAIKNKKNPSKGCYDSFHSIIQHAKQNDLDYVIIMEDDNEIFDSENFEHRFLKTIKFLEDQTNEWEIFKFSYNFLYEIQSSMEIYKINKEYDIYSMNYSFAANFLIINKSIYDKIIPYDKHATSSFDLYINRFINWYLHPMLTYQIDGMSSITGQMRYLKYQFQETIDFVNNYNFEEEYNIQVIVYNKITGWDDIQQQFNKTKYPYLSLNKHDCIDADESWKSVTLSHCNVIKWAKAQKLDYVIVMEDGSYLYDKRAFNDSFKTIMEYLERYLNEWDVFRFTASINSGNYDFLEKKWDIGRYKIYNFNTGYLNNFIVYNKSIYDALIKHGRLAEKSSSFFDMIDQSIAKYTSKQLCCLPSIAYQKSESGSSSEMMLVNQQNDIFRYLRDTNKL